MSEHAMSEQSPEQAPTEHGCPNCGAPMQDSQDWCLRCGTGRQGERGGPGWRSAAAAFGAAAILAMGAAAAAYAALNQSSPHPRPPVTPVAQTPTSTSETTSSTTSSGAVTSEGLPRGTSKPPKIPASESTPSSGSGGGLFGEEKEKSSGKGSSKAGKSGKGKGGEEAKKGTSSGGKEGKDKESSCETEQDSTTSTSSEGTSGSASESSSESDTKTTSATTSTGEQEQAGEEGGCGKQAAKRAPILLDTDAASTYNPNGYPEGGFGDPSLAIDGEATTAWTAPLAPELAPLVQSGLVLNLKTQRDLAKVTLIASTPGMSVQIYGTAQRKPPSSLDSPAWLKLSRVDVVAKRKSSIYLRRTEQMLRQLLVWIVKAPSGAESVAIGEVELYEPK